MCVNHWDGVRVGALFSVSVVEAGGEGGIWYTMVLMSSSRHQATLPRSVAFDCSNPSFLFRQRKMTPPERVRSFSLSMGYEKDIFAVFAYEFELSQYDLYSSSTPSSKTASNSSSPRPSMMSLKRSIAMPIESVACFCFSLASKTSAIRLL